MLDRLTADEALVDRFVYLVGRPPLKDFTGFVTEQGVNGQDADVGALTEEWHAASRYIQELQSQEKGPCIIQHVSTREELDAAASGDLRRNPEPYLRQARPPMFKDYFDPRLHRIVPVPRRLRQVRVKFEIEESDVPGL